jgi:rRNA-processing protein FCF1
VITMRRVLIDACGWVAVIEAGINIDKALLECSGIRNIAIVKSVMTELEALPGNYLLGILSAKAEVVEAEKEVGHHTDDQLFSIAQKENWPVLTVDTEFKRRLSIANLPWIEVSGRSHLRLVD